MNSKKNNSSSIGRIPASPKELSILNANFMKYYSRLEFPQPGNTLFYSHSGRKHYQNHSDKLLKIVLPNAYALNNPLGPRQNSQPNLRISQPASPVDYSERLSSKGYEKKSPSFSYKYDDELDKMKFLMDNKKGGSPMIQKVKLPELDNPQRSPSRRVEIKQTINKLSYPMEQLSPVARADSRRKIQAMAPLQHIIKTPVHETKVRNPSFLSSCISYI